VKRFRSQQPEISKAYQDSLDDPVRSMEQVVYTHGQASGDPGCFSYQEQAATASRSSSGALEHTICSRGLALSAPCHSADCVLKSVHSPMGVFPQCVPKAIELNVRAPNETLDIRGRKAARAQTTLLPLKTTPLVGRTMLSHNHGLISSATSGLSAESRWSTRNTICHGVPETIGGPFTGTLCAPPISDRSQNLRLPSW
jgi:hypothetical protein